MELVLPFILALQFLTIIPVRFSRKASDKQISSSVPWFPVVALLIGLIAQILYMGCLTFFSSVLSDCLAIFSMVLLSGGAQLGGLARLIDGWGVHSVHEDTTAVAKDSRHGAIGIAALVMLLMLKVYAFHDINNDHKYLVLILMPVMGRWIQVYLFTFGTYAKADGAFSPYFQPTKVPFILASLIPAFLILQVFKLKGVLIIIIFFSLFYLYILWLRHKLGGQTEDTVGAASELSELLLLFVVLIFTKLGWIWPSWL